MKFIILAFCLLLAGQTSYAKEEVQIIKKPISVMSDGTLSLAPYIIKKSAVKSKKVLFNGAELGAYSNTLDPSFKYVYNDEWDNYYIKNVGDDLYPIEKIIVRSTIKTKKIYSISFELNQKIKYDFEECVALKNSFLNSAYKKYGGKYANYEGVSTFLAEDGGNSWRESYGEVVLDNKIDFYVRCYTDTRKKEKESWNMTVDDFDIDRQNVQELQHMHDIEREKESNKKKDAMIKLFNGI